MKIVLGGNSLGWFCLWSESKTNEFDQVETIRERERDVDVGGG